MPLATIAIEQTAPDKWFAQVEAGGMPGGPLFRMVHLTAGSLGELLGRVAETHAALMPTPKGARPPAEWVAASELKNRGTIALAPTHVAVSPKPRWPDGPAIYDITISPGDREELRRVAASLGVEVDGRWHAPRLREEIASARERWSQTEKVE